MVELTKEESVEIENFRVRREDFNDELSVKNVHNVPTMFPNMYKRIFETTSLKNNLFSIGRKRYCDANEDIVSMYEQALNKGYVIAN